MSPEHALIKRIGEVAEAVGWQAGVGASETAGMIISCLYANPDLIPRFIEEGTGLLIDGSIGPDQGCLTFHRGSDGKVTTVEELRLARQARKMLIDSGATPPAPDLPSRFL